MSSIRQVPILIALGIGFSWFFSVVAAAVTVFAIVDAAFLGGVGQYRVGEESVSPGKFLVTGGPVVVSVSALMLSIAVGLQRRRPWSRLLILAFWFALLLIGRVVPASEADSRAGSLSLLLPALFSWWYLFRKATVIAYFGDSEATATADPTTHVRPVGVTLLALSLGWLSVAGLANAAIYVGGVRLETMNPALAIGALLYGVTAAAAARGLWLHRPWALQAFLAWAASVLAFLFAFSLSVGSEVLLGGGWGAAAFSCVVVALLAWLHSYVRVAIPPAAQQGGEPEVE